MTASLLAAPKEVMAWDRDEVAAFDRSGEDILVVARPPVPEIAGAVASARVHDFRSGVTREDADVRAAEALAALRLDCPALADDIAGLARSFLAQFGVEGASLRVELVDKTSCPKFHCDNVRVRLVATCYGPGTEYVRVADPGVVQAAPTSALVFLKGHRHPAHADAVLHRSPPVPPGGKRLCVILDV